jgi:hypothetical protein
VPLTVPATSLPDDDVDVMVEPINLQNGDYIKLYSSGAGVKVALTLAENTDVAGATTSDDLAEGTTNLYLTSAERSKLSGIATGAEVNQNAFSNVAVSGQTTVEADAKTDTLTLVAGTGVTITTDATTDSITITNSATGANAFGNVAVSGQTTVEADSTNDTLTLAAASSNIVLTTDASADTVTIGLASTPSVDGIIVGSTGFVSATGNLSLTTGDVSCVDITSSGTSNLATVVVSSSFTTTGISFTGGGTSTIGPDNSLPTDPADLLIRSNGNVDVVLDYDDDESSQAFRVKDGDGNTMFSVDEDGISVANGTASTGAVIRLGEATANGSNYVGIQAPASLAANVTYTLPTADGTSGQVLTTNGSGTLSWATDATGGGGSSYSAVRTQSGTTYTLVIGDAGDYIQTTSTTAVTITVPPQSSVAWAADTEIYFEQNNTGQLTIAAGSGVTINSSETLKTFARYSVIALKRVAEDVWTLTGERALV